MVPLFKFDAQLWKHLLQKKLNAEWPGKLQFCYISLKIENVISHLKFMQEQIRIKIRFT